MIKVAEIRKLEPVVIKGSVERWLEGDAEPFVCLTPDERDDLLAQHDALLVALKSLLAEHAILNEYARIIGKGHPEDGAHPDCPTQNAIAAIAMTEGEK